MLTKNFPFQSEYYGVVLLGHPGQTFNVVFDTTWGDSFVPSEYCGPDEAGCRKWPYTIFIYLIMYGSI